MTRLLLQGSPFIIPTERHKFLKANDGILLKEATIIFILVRFQVLTAMNMKMAVFWVVAPCNVRFTHRPDNGGSKHL
jgi:hypothetical protein